MRAAGNLETIRELAMKLLALSDPHRGGSPAECEAASRKLEALLQRHGLTVSDLGDEAVEPRVFEVLNEMEKRLFVQCACFILDCSTIRLTTRKQARITFGKRSRKGRAVKYLELEMELTKVQYADLTACFAYYREIMASQKAEIEQKIKTLKKSLTVLVDAIAGRYDIFSSSASSEEPDAPVDLKRLAALMEAMRGLDGQPWQRPRGELSGLTLTHGRDVA